MGSTGEYMFRTIKPVPYPGRAPHIHFAVKIKGQEKFTSQCYIQGEPGNERDNQIRDARAKASVIEHARSDQRLAHRRDGSPF